jgi:hypothetical protein
MARGNRQKEWVVLEIASKPMTSTLILLSEGTSTGSVRTDYKEKKGECKPFYSWISNNGM